MLLTCRRCICAMYSAFCRLHRDWNFKRVGFIFKFLKRLNALRRCGLPPLNIRYGSMTSILCLPCVPRHPSIRFGHFARALTDMTVGRPPAVIYAHRVGLVRWRMTAALVPRVAAPCAPRAALFQGESLLGPTHRVWPFCRVITRWQ